MLRLEEYYQLLARWNARINLTSLPLDGYPDGAVDRLIVEPLAAARFIDNASLIWFDLGSGGGSPAIPLKIARPKLRLVMIESRSRKAAFLREAVRTLELGESSVICSRVEDLSSESDGLADLVTVRAVRLDETFLKSAVALLDPSGRLIVFSTTDKVSVPDFRTVNNAPLPSGGSVFVLRR
jgi:16S rRNA (guanine527-N7)-methyltransferase